MAHIGYSECNAQTAPRKPNETYRIANFQVFRDQCMRSDSVLLQDIDLSLENPRSQLERVCWTLKVQSLLPARLPCKTVLCSTVRRRSTITLSDGVFPLSV